MIAVVVLGDRLESLSGPDGVGDRSKGSRVGAERVERLSVGGVEREYRQELPSGLERRRPLERLPPLPQPVGDRLLELRRELRPARLGRGIVGRDGERDLPLLEGTAEVAALLEHRRTMPVLCDQRRQAGR